MPQVRSASVALECGLTAPGTARSWGHGVLSEWLPFDEAVFGGFELLLSELVTNAVRAKCTNIVVTARLQDDRLRVAVCDNAPGRPTLISAAPTDDHGRGLMIVSMLADDWGVAPAADGKEVWAELAAR